jgi:two-component system, OmpR family, response regulator
MASDRERSGRPHRILVVDDDARIRRLLHRLLSTEGYLVDSASGGTGMRRALGGQPFDLVILDLRLAGGEDGLSLAQGLRATSDVSLIMLTGKGEPVDKVVGLEVGADDYITKPFDRRELIARIRSVLRRAGASRAAGAHQPGDGHVFRFGGWTLDLTRHELTSENAQRIELTTYEFLLLSALAQRPGQVLSRDRILDVIANRNWQPYDRSIDVLVGKLRRKLNDDPRSPRLIRTIRGIGYMLTPPANQG